MAVDDLRERGEALGGRSQLGVPGVDFCLPGLRRLYYRGGGKDLNIAAASQGLFPLLTGWTPPFKEVLNWLQFSYTTDRTGAYMAPASMVLVQSAVVELDALFTAYFQQLCKCYPRAYAPSMIDPGPEYLFATNAWAPDYRELNRGEEWGEGIVNLNNSIFSELGTTDLGRINNLSVGMVALKYTLYRN